MSCFVIDRIGNRAMEIPAYRLHSIDIDATIKKKIASGADGVIIERVRELTWKR